MIQISSEVRSFWLRVLLMILAALILLAGQIYWQRETINLSNQIKETESQIYLESKRYVDADELMSELIPDQLVEVELVESAERQNLKVLSFEEGEKEDYRGLCRTIHYMTLTGDFFAIVNWIVDVEGGTPWAQIEIREFKPLTLNSCELKVSIYLHSTK